MRKRTLILFILLVGSVAVTVHSNVISSPLQGILDKIEMRRNQWTAMEADITLYFMAEAKSQAACRGELTYHRLEEKIFLKCFGESGKLLFSFKTNDDAFELYIPPKDTKITGSIFDLEDSPDIEAHLKPLDLYRALKPMAIFPDRSHIDDWKADLITLSVFGQRHLTPYLQRKLFVSSQGDILKEIYYSFTEVPFLTIRRTDFQTFGLADSRGSGKVFYPKQIVIDTHPRQKSIALTFDSLRFFSYLEKTDWPLETTANTRVLSLEEFSEKNND